MTSLVNSYNNWGRLEEVWLGDVYPVSWYDHLNSEVRDCFYEITEKTQEDLNTIQKKLEEFGIIVGRPTYDKIENYLNHDEVLIKPEICPRDYYVTIGNTLYANDIWHDTNPWQKHLTHYVNHNSNSVKDMLQKNSIHINGANTVRVGKDLYFDIGANQENVVAQYQDNFSSIFKEYRVHILSNGGHVDGCFALLKPGVIMASKYFNDYDSTFPNWKLINLSNPEFKNHRQRRPGTNDPVVARKWWLPDMTYKKAFNDHVLKYAQDWIGDYTETFFELNCLVIDEKNVIMLGENEAVFRELEKHNITAHSVPFRTRTFWDGGMHCLTLDIRRQSILEDYFPERENQKLFVYN